MNKLKLFCVLLVVVIISACSKNLHILNKSIIEEIPTNELSDILDYEKTHKVAYGAFNGFEEMYPSIRKVVENMSEIERAKYAKLSYRELANAQIESEDSILLKTYEDEWQKKYDEMLPQAMTIAEEISNQIVSGLRIALFYHNNISIRDYIKNEGLNKFIIGPIDFISELDDYSNKWRYEVIIREKIDSSFDSKEIWVRKKALETIKSKYPLGYDFLMDRLKPRIDFYRYIEEQ